MSDITYPKCQAEQEICTDDGYGLEKERLFVRSMEAAQCIDKILEIKT